MAVDCTFLSSKGKLVTFLDESFRQYYVFERSIHTTKRTDIYIILVHETCFTLNVNLTGSRLDKLIAFTRDFQQFLMILKLLKNSIGSQTFCDRLVKRGIRNF